MTALAEMETGDIMAADSSVIGDKEAYAKHEQRQLAYR
jgi:hypothetical protein